MFINFGTSVSNRKTSIWVFSICLGLCTVSKIFFFCFYFPEIATYLYFSTLGLAAVGRQAETGSVRVVLEMGGGRANLLWLGKTPSFLLG